MTPRECPNSILAGTQHAWTHQHSPLTDGICHQNQLLKWDDNCPSLHRKTTQNTSVTILASWCYCSNTRCTLRYAPAATVSNGIGEGNFHSRVGNTEPKVWKKVYRKSRRTSQNTLLCSHITRMQLAILWLPFFSQVSILNAVNLGCRHWASPLFELSFR